MTHNEGHPMSLYSARGLADLLCERWKPYCTRIDIVGDIRRGLEEVHEVAILAEPQWAVQCDFDGHPTGPRTNLFELRIRAELEQGLIALRYNESGVSANMERIKHLWFVGVMVDLYVCTPPAQWGLSQVLWTGPAWLRHALVTPASKGGYLPPKWRIANGAIWRTPTEIVPMPTEQDVFRELGRPYIDPSHRR